MASGRQGGSALLSVLFFCLGTLALFMGLSAAFGLWTHSSATEDRGRGYLSRVQRGLSASREALESRWVPDTYPLDDAGEASSYQLAPPSARALRLVVRVPRAADVLSVSVTVESGGDGLTLPLRALVAESIETAPGRATPVVTVEEAVARVSVDTTPERDPPLVTTRAAAPEWLMGVGIACEVRQVSAPLYLGGEGLCEASRPGRGDRVQCAAVRTPPWVPPSDLGRSAESALLIIGDPAQRLDLRGLGDLFAVVLVGTGGLACDGTVIHGAVFGDGAVDVGESGSVAFRADVLNWAMSDSLRRVRLLRGTRQEESVAQAP